MTEPAELPDLKTALGYEFTDASLLELAVTHRSYCAENGNVESNERLEFLGDAILGLAVAERLFNKHPGEAEGFLAKGRSDVVSAPSLAKAAEALGIGNVLLLGKGEELSGGRNKESILADAMEAVIAAVYLDSGWDEASNLIHRHLKDAVPGSGLNPGSSDYKSRLQERAAHLLLGAPRYETTSTGPDHELVFISTVTVQTTTGTGRGTSKKLAQQQAANAALDELDALNPEKIDRTEWESGQSEQQPATVPSGGTQ